MVALNWVEGRDGRTKSQENARSSGEGVGVKKKASIRTGARDFTMYPELTIHRLSSVSEPWE